jgi:hydrogenase nickel incorporation protein HypB
MCSTCGCGGPEGEAKILKPGEHHHDHPHDHHHDHDHDHHHTHDHSHDHPHDHHHGHDHHHTKSILEVEQDILSANNLAAERNRGYFEALNITALNLVSSPGSGKTTLLETTIKDLGDEMPFAVIEGDQQTTNDADRIDQLNIPVRQINTGKGCHLDSEMIRRAYQDLKPAQDSILMIENVGNLVCPALFDLGERYRVVIISTTEGDDKPLKYPDMFAHSHICIINKIDLLPYVQFDVDKVKANALKINPSLAFFEVSATSGEGMSQWYDWLKEMVSSQNATT